ncbi:unnamed protein product [Ixodes pacificus]
MKPSPQRESEERHTSDQEQMKKLQSQLEGKDKELAQLRSLNMKLQERLLKQDEDKKRNQPLSHLGQCNIRSRPDHKRMCSDVPQRLFEAADESLKEHRPAPNEDKVDLGQEIYLNRRVWEELNRSEKDTIFAKELAVTLCGPRELMKRSSKGKHSPRYLGMPKTPAISPVKLAVIEDCYRERLQKGACQSTLLGRQLSRIPPAS